MFKDLESLHKWLAFDVMDAYCSKRWLDAEDGQDACQGCPLHGCEDCPTKVIELARGLQWQRA